MEAAMTTTTSEDNPTKVFLPTKVAVLLHLFDEEEVLCPHIISGDLVDGGAYNAPT